MIPYGPWQAGVRRILAGGAPYIFYIHPWELDPGQPRLEGLGRLNRFRHYVNLERSEQRFRALVSGFRWQTVGQVLEQWKAAPAG